MRVTYKERPVDIEITGATYDHDDWCDAFIENAFWEDTELEFTDKELDDINDYFQTAEAGNWIIDWLY